VGKEVGLHRCRTAYGSVPGPPEPNDGCARPKQPYPCGP
jgi:hypothetical protein